jgi:hypothetical protein
MLISFPYSNYFEDGYFNESVPGNILRDTGIHEENFLNVCLRINCACDFSTLVRGNSDDRFPRCGCCHSLFPTRKNPETYYSLCLRGFLSLSRQML